MIKIASHKHPCGIAVLKFSLFSELAFTEEIFEESKTVDPFKKVLAASISMIKLMSVIFWPLQMGFGVTLIIYKTSHLLSKFSLIARKNLPLNRVPVRFFVALYEVVPVA